MGQTKKRNYDRYTLAFKTQAVISASHPGVRAVDIAEALGIHVVMLYRWQMEYRNGELKANKHMTKPKPSPKRRASEPDVLRQKDDALVKANKRIRQLEKALENRTEEVDLLKKAQRFFEVRKK